MRMAKKIAEGWFLIADSCVVERSYTYPSGNAHSKDMERLSSDVRSIGNDMKKTTTKHGKRTYQLTGN